MTHSAITATVHEDPGEGGLPLAERPALCVLVGATGTGKNTVGARVAHDLGLEVVSLDALKVYRRLDIGTSKPTPEELALAPHHAIDVVEPSEPFDVTRYLEVADAACAEIHARGRRPLFVGGTGMYLQILLHGQFDGPGADADVRATLDAAYKREGAEAMHARLAAVDPDAATRLHPNDRKRVMRALEVFELTGEPISARQQQFGAIRRDVRPVIAGLRWPREELDARLNARTAEMFAAGWIDEVRRVRDEPPGFGVQARAGLGYREILQWLECGAVEGADPPITDEASLEALVAQRTRRLTRKQMNWFGRHDVRWFDIDSATIPDAIARDVSEFFATALDG